MVETNTGGILFSLTHFIQFIVIRINIFIYYLFLIALIIISLSYFCNFLYVKFILSKIKEKKIKKMLKKNSKKMKYNNAEFKNNSIDMEQSSKLEEMVICIICYEDIKEGDLITTIPECLHEMHSSCLSEWIKIKLSCPICRININLD